MSSYISLPRVTIGDELRHFFSLSLSTAVNAKTVTNVRAFANSWDFRTDSGCGPGGCDPRFVTVSTSAPEVSIECSAAAVRAAHSSHPFACERLPVGGIGPRTVNGRLQRMTQSRRKIHKLGYLQTGDSPSPDALASLSLECLRSGSTNILIYPSLSLLRRSNDWMKFPRLQAFPTRNVAYYVTVSNL